MMILAHLKGVPLAEAEALAALQLKNTKRDGRFFIGEAEPRKVMLAYSHAVYELLFSCDAAGLEKRCEVFDWQMYCRGSYAVRSSKSQVELADIIWRSLKQPKVDLSKPKTIFQFFFGRKAYACRLLQEMPKPLPSTTSWPEFHPASMDTRLARAMVNLAQSKTILDPFCGIGTIPIEAALQDRKAMGSDIDPIMVKRARINAKHLKAKAALKVADAFKANAPTMVTELPFGKNSRMIGPDDFFEGFLKRCKAKRLVAVFPEDKKILRAAKRHWKVEQHHTIRVHKSLTKMLLVCSQK